MGKFLWLCIPLFTHFLCSLQAHEDDVHQEKLHSSCDPKEGLREDTCLLQLQVDELDVDADKGIHKANGGGPSLIQRKTSKYRISRSPAAVEAASTLPREGVNDLDGQASHSYKPVDWLFTASPNACQTAVWDNDQYTQISRLMLPVTFLVIAVFIVLNGTHDDAEGSVEIPQRNGEHQQVRRYDLDFARIVCVACVVCEHSGGTNYTQNNVAFCLQWVLPYLYLTSATAWMRSKKELSSFIARLSVVLIVGVGANWVADMMTGRNWQGDFGNTIFQMFYVVMLISMAFLTAPLKQALLQRRANTERPVVQLRFWIAMVSFGAITAMAFVGYIYQKKDRSAIETDRGSWLHNFQPVLRHAPIAMIQIAGALFLTHLACLFRANDIFPWLLLVYIYLPRIFIPWEQVGFLHNLELFVFAMAAEAWTLKGSRVFSMVVQSYWPIIVFVLMISSMPDMYGRCDLIPPFTCLERFRFYSIELCLVLILTTGAIKVGDPYHVTEWLNYWALYAYCFHVAWARLLPIPYGAAFTYASGAVVYLAWRSSSGKQPDVSNGKQPDTSKGDMAGGG